MTTVPRSREECELRALDMDAHARRGDGLSRLRTSRSQFCYPRCRASFNDSRATGLRILRTPGSPFDCGKPSPRPRLTLFGDVGVFEWLAQCVGERTNSRVLKQLCERNVASEDFLKLPL